MSTGEHRAEILYVENSSSSEIAERIANKQVGILDWGDPHSMIYVMIGDSRDIKVTVRMNRIKGRPEDQALAVAGFAGIIPHIADLSKSQAWEIARQRRGLSHEDLLDRIYHHQVGLILPARDHLPDAISKVNARGIRTVMVAGQSHNNNFNYLDLYNPTVQTLFYEYGIVAAGTSAHKGDNDSYTTYDQNRACEALGDKVDFIVLRKVVPRPRRLDSKIASCTAFDVAGDKVVLERLGSREIARFREYLGAIDIPSEVKVLTGAEVYLPTRISLLLKQSLHWSQKHAS